MNYLQLRRQAFVRNLAKSSVEAFLVTNPVNVAYLTGFTGGNSFLFASGKHSILISDSRYEQQIQDECTGLDTNIQGCLQTTVEAAAEVLNKSGAKTVAVEQDHITLSMREQLQTLAPRIMFVPVSGVVEKQRVLKDPGEVEQIKDAVRVAERAFRMFIATVRDIDSEKEMADSLDGYIRRCGARGSSFPPIVAVGERGALPHALPTGKLLGEGTKVLVDWGADMLYKSDLTRTLKSAPGTSPSRKNKYERVGVKFEEVYSIVLQAQDAALEAIRPGVRAKDVDAAARKVFATARLRSASDLKLLDHFTHGLGHGIGLEVHEAPRIRSNSDDLLENGMVITIEPAIYIPGWGGVRIEDDVLITPHGASLLTSLPREAMSLAE